MSLTVLSFCSYIMGGENLRNAHWSALKFVRSIKGDTINGYADVTFAGKNYRIDERNPRGGIDLFATLIATAAKKLKAPRVALVPVPSSTAVTKGAECVTATIAAAAVAKAPSMCVVAHVLRWSSPTGSARKGTGTRNVETLYSKLVVDPSWKPEPIPHLLIDDVCTSGNHLRACAAALRKRGVDVSAAICAGRTVHETPDNPFALITEELPDFVPKK